MTTDQPSTSDRIAAAMAREDRSQKWVAERANIPLTTFRRKLHGGNDLTLNEVLAIATALGVHPAALLPAEFARAAA